MSSSASRRSSKADSSSADRQAQALRDIQASVADNKKCFECQQRGPTYVDVTIGSFVCTKCSGVLRGITPPHRVKSISMSSFTPDDIERMRSRGNLYCAKVWLGLYDVNLNGPIDTKDEDAIKDFIVQKYEKKRYYVDPSSIRHTLEQQVKPPELPGQEPPASKYTCNLIGSTIQQSVLADKAQHMNPAGIKSSEASGLPTSASAPSSSATSISRKKGAHADFASANLSGFAVKDGTSDPFGGSSNRSSAAGLAMPSSSSSSPPPPPPSSSSSTTSASHALGAQSFANFDNASFFGPALASSAVTEPLTATTNSSLTSPPYHQTAPLTMPAALLSATAATAPASTSGSRAVPQDRYAALKDLDEIFKSAVTIGDSPAKSNAMNNGHTATRGVRNGGGASSNSTGASFFGNVSPIPQQQQPQPPLVSSSAAKATGAWNQSDWTLGSSNGGSSVASWDWPASATFGNGPQQPAPSGSTNPFTSNNSQLNTSPWPVTTSPQASVQAAPLQLGASKASAFSTSPWGPPTPCDAFSPVMAPSSTTNLPFQSDQHFDLFSKAPFGGGGNEAVRDLTQDIFGTSSSGFAGHDQPWTVGATNQATTTPLKPAGSHSTTNPFL